MYCIEGLDQTDAPTVFDWYLDLDHGGFRSEWNAEMLGGIVTMRHRASRSATPLAQQPVYELLDEEQFVDGELTFVPYYTFHNRGTTSMEVWIPYRATPEPRQNPSGATPSR